MTTKGRAGNRVRAGMRVGNRVRAGMSVGNRVRANTTHLKDLPPLIINNFL